MSEQRLALGLMSGTSMDGIDAALLRTDGIAAVEPVHAISIGYDVAMRQAIRDAVADPADAARLTRLETDLTDRHLDAISVVLDEAGLKSADVDVIGFHGQTIHHDAAAGTTTQIGDGARMARATGCLVVNDFRSADIVSGGQGAPFAPLFHAALAVGLTMPVCVLNIGGVANVTWVGAYDGLEGAGIFDHLLAFDTGPGGALLDDWVYRHTGAPFDAEGRLAQAGKVDAGVLAALLDHPFFDRPAPKSLDRNEFAPAALAGLSVEDGAATLMAFTVAAIAAAQARLPEPPTHWLVTGGGRHNTGLMAALDTALDAGVEAIESAGWDGDVLEAQAFAYLAVRRLRNLPASGPSTTAVPMAVVGGVVNRPHE